MVYQKKNQLKNWWITKGNVYFPLYLCLGTHFAGGSGWKYIAGTRSEVSLLSRGAQVLVLLLSSGHVCGQNSKNATTWFLSPGHFIKHQSRYSSEGILKMELKVCYDLSVHTPSHYHTSPNSYTETLTLNVMILEGGAFRRWLVLDVMWGESCDGTGASGRRKKQSFLCPLCEDIARRQLSTSQEAGFPQEPNLLAAVFDSSL